MSRIDDLIRERCNHGVQHCELGQAASYSATRVASKELSADSFVGVDNILPNKGGVSTAVHSPNTDRLSSFQAGDVLLGNIRPYLKKVWLADRSGGCSGDVLAIRIHKEWKARLLPGFLFYLLSADAFFAYDMQHAKGAKMPRGDKEAIMRYRIPVPPQEVQREIVQILDQFTQLQAELEAELKVRRLQYAHYRTALLKYKSGEAWRRTTLGALTRSIAAGRNKRRLETGAVPVFGSTGRLGYTDRAVYTGDALLVARVGANAGRVNAVSGDYDVTDNTLVLSLCDGYDTRFAFHQLTHADINQYAVGGGQPLITAGMLKALEMNVPPVREQRRVAALLDKFDALENDLSIGLPAELAARRKQYEYYRDKLLTFEE